MFATWRRYLPRMRPVSARRRGPVLETLESRLVPSFYPAYFYPAASNPTAVIVRDFNNDQRDDIAVSNLGGSVSLLLSNGDGTFEVMPETRADTNSRNLVAGDFDRDGNLDLAVANHISTTLPGSVSILLGNGDGTFRAAVQYVAGTGPSSVDTADFNRDTIPDLVVAHYNGASVGVLLGNGDGTFQNVISTPAGANPADVKAADFNYDNVPDVIVARRTGGNVGILFGLGDGTFLAPVNYATGPQAFELELGDVNLDTVLDVVVAHRPTTAGNHIAVLLGTGQGTFNPVVTYAAGGNSWAVALADLDLDGFLDIASAGHGTRNLSVLRSNGDGTFGAPLTFATASSPFGVAVGDFFIDGVTDAVLANHNSDDVAIYLNVFEWGTGPGAAPGGQGVVELLLEASRPVAVPATDDHELTPEESRALVQGVPDDTHPQREQSASLVSQGVVVSRAQSEQSEEVFVLE